MKKIISILLSTIMLFSTGCIVANAAEPETKTVYLTITNANLEFEIYREAIKVEDLNADGTFTIDEAFTCAHNQKFTGGADAGYNSSSGFLSKFWGVENGGGFSYFLNNSDTQVNTTMLQTPLNDNDDLNLHIFKDLTTWSDSFSYFDINSKNILTGENVTLTLMKKSMFDNAFKPASNATITIDGVSTNYKTDDNGVVTLPINEIGTKKISAVSDEYIIAPPMCVVNVSPKSANVFVTMVNDNKNLELAQENILVTDADNDKMLTINDAMICTHNQKFPGGADAGFETQLGAYGLQIIKLWGVVNGGSYGYYLNNAFCMGLNVPIKDNDYLNAFIYSDTMNYTDSYAYFDTQVKEANTNEEIKLTLNKISFGPEGFLPVKGAKIVINGVETSFETNENGVASIKIENPGTYTVSAISDNENIVTPVCKIAVKAVAIENEANNDNTNNNDNNSTDNVKSPNTGSENIIILSLIIISALGITLVNSKKSKKYEN